MDAFLDVEAVEKSESQIDQFIEKRAREKQEANRAEEAWAESTRRVNEKRRRADRWAWIDHHGLMHRLHSDLAASHADKRSRLLAECGYEPEEAPGPEAA